jgi:hypothetical protein
MSRNLTDWWLGGLSGTLFGISIGIGLVTMLNLSLDTRFLIAWLGIGGSMMVSLLGWVLWIGRGNRPKWMIWLTRKPPN